jgi:quinoprotein glucose dehydrogenase
VIPLSSIPATALSSTRILTFALLFSLLPLTRPLFSQEHSDWAFYNGSPSGNHYSSLTQINRSNVKNLQLVWTFDTAEEGGLETNPLIIDGVLYGITPTQKIFALNAATGHLLWKFDSGILGTQPDRGLAYWSDPNGNDKRILAGVMNYVYALDVATGKPIPSFGRNGRIDLRQGLGREPASAQSVVLTSPPIVFKDMFIVGARNPESLPAPPGDIRSFDVHSGKVRWTFHTIPHPGELGYDTWPSNAWKTSGAANNWAGMSLDVPRGILYVPTGSAASDFYGPDRIGDDLFANCLLALNAETGQLFWYFQGVRHDLWDRDFPAPPVLLTIHLNGRNVDAVAQTSKQGYVFLFGRMTGQPLFPIDYRNYPKSSLPGEVAAAQQGLPTKPAPFARQLFTEDMLTTRTPEAHQWALQQFKTFRSAGQFVPFSVGKPTVVFPGFDGGAEWGGPALDPTTSIIYINSNDIVWTGALAETSTHKTAKALYSSACALCHGDNRQGSPPTFPSLLHVADRLSHQQIAETVQTGKGRMPGFSNLSGDQVDALVHFLCTGEDTDFTAGGALLPAMKYHLTGYNRFLDPDGYPAVQPPWGTLNAINLDTGEYVWKIPFGEYPALAAQGVTNTGTENYGGPIVTAGGLLFIAATNYDKKFRAYDKSTGQLLWETTLPFAGNATPATYTVNGRQFIVIAAGGGKDLRSKSGGVYVAFALPK